MSFSSDDLQLLSKIEDATETEEKFIFNNQNVELQVGRYELKNGYITLSFPNIASTQDDYKQLKNKVEEIVRLNAYRQFEAILKDIVFFNHIYQRDYSPKAFFFPAERATLNQYAFDIIYSRAEKYEESDNPYPFETARNLEVETPEYPKAINDYIKLVFNLKKKEKKKSAFEKYAIELENLIEGNVYIDHNGSIKYKLPDNKNLSMHIVSSTVKSLAGIIIYLRHLAQDGDIIFIDEPELNLHPVNQRFFARILAKLTNAGIKVVISTHSDYISKELSSLLLLDIETAKTEKLFDEYQLSGEEFIEKSNVKVYTFSKQGIVSSVPVADDGIEIESFDKQIEEQGSMFDKIYYLTSEK